MNQARALYYMMKKSTPAKLKEAIISGDLSGCLVTGLNALSREAQQEVIAYGRKIASVNRRPTADTPPKTASNMVEPFGLGEYLSYKYCGSAKDFAKGQGITLAHLEQAIASGCYWHNGAIHALVPLILDRGSFCAKGIISRPPVVDFIDSMLEFGGEDSHIKDLWMAYVLTPNMMTLGRSKFGKALEHELGKRGYSRTTSLRIGSRVSTGYKGVSLKGNKK